MSLNCPNWLRCLYDLASVTSAGNQAQDMTSLKTHSDWRNDDDDDDDICYLKCETTETDVLSFNYS